ncbi:transposase [Photobacterium frigidiphilum]
MARLRKRSSLHTAESNQGKRPATIDAYSRALRRITHHFDTNKWQWINCKNQYLFNAFLLANVWRARLLSHITDTLKLAIPRRLPQKWVVNCRHVGRGKSALLYLSKYLYRGVLADNDILYEENGNITSPLDYFIFFNKFWLSITK